LADAPAVHSVSDLHAAGALAAPAIRPASAPLSLRSSGHILLAQWKPFVSILGSLLVLSLVYCLIAPRQFEAREQLALRAAPFSALNMDSAGTAPSGSFASGETQLETLANVLRSDQLAWRVILDKKLYQAPGFSPSFAAHFPLFRPDSPTPGARDYLLGQFQDALQVRTVPRTLLLEMHFRSRDPGLSADVLNDLVGSYQEQEAESRVFATAQAAGFLGAQLNDLKAKSDKDDQRLAEFQGQHGLLIAPESLANGNPGAAQHAPVLLEVDELSRQAVAASSERILREAEFRAASNGDPELVLASDPRLQELSGGLSVAAFRQIHQRHSELEQEQAQLAAEHGPNFPRVVEIRRQMDDLDKQLQSQDTLLRERFRTAWQTSLDREQMIRKGLAERTDEGRHVATIEAQYEAMRREAEASRELYLRTQSKVQEAGLAAGVQSGNLWIVDPAHTPSKPALPDVPLVLAVTLFAGAWFAAGVVFACESIRAARLKALAAFMVLLMAPWLLRAQAPTPSTSGLPTGVVRLPPTPDTKNVPNPREAPSVWTSAATAVPGVAGSISGSDPGPIAPGEILDIAESHTPEFRSIVRVSATGTVTLPMIGDITVDRLDETGAAKAIAAALLANGMLLHPVVTVLITAPVGQDVTVLGEVGRPGVYPYGAHHRLLDLISAASGLSVSAGGLVDVVHRDDPGRPQMVTLDFSQAGGLQQNPELRPGDTVRVSRAGLVYVVGDVNRPGGFTLDPAQTTTVLQALSLAWGPSQNAALSKALLIQVRGDGRNVTTLNLKRMLRGQDPDVAVGERDILFVPDSAARNLWNRTMESVVQSAAGVSIYAGMVYSQRF
jgi:uncharacterized protein involved in exopolysaccharide biosynthesis/protein involved in polysaccharide export with SLBB domain